MVYTKKHVISTVKKWAHSQPGLVALVMVGSCARGTEADDSDIDFVLITNDPQRYLQATARVAILETSTNYPSSTT